MTSKRPLNPTPRVNSFVRRAALVVSVCTLGLLSVACSNASNGSDTQGSADMFSFLFGKKKAPTTVNPVVGAELVKIDKFPALPQIESVAESGMSCKKVRMQGELPKVSFSDPGEVTEFENPAFTVTGISEIPSIALLNTEATPFEIWELDSSNNSLQKKRELVLDIDQDRSRFVRVSQVSCLPAKRLLVSIKYIDSSKQPTRRQALYSYELETNKFTRLSRNEDVVYGHFQTRPIGPKYAIAMYGTNMVRQSAEIYHHYFDHYFLFTPQHPNGIEVLTLGIDIGTALKWGVVNDTLYLHTSDERRGKSREGFWSLDLSKLITQEKSSSP